MDAGLTKPIAIIYLLLFGAFLAAALLNLNVAGFQLDRNYDAWFPAALIVVAIGILRRTIWGRWLCYIVSLPLIAGVPIGTLLGGFMVWHLTKYRGAFNKWV